MKNWVRCFFSVLLIVIGISLTGCEPVDISGTIVNAEGESISDEVTIFLLHLADSDVQVQAITKTSDGYFEFPEAPDGQYVILPIWDRHRFEPALIPIEIKARQAAAINETSTNDEIQIAALSLQKSNRDSISNSIYNPMLTTSSTDWIEAIRRQENAIEAAKAEMKQAENEFDEAAMNEYKEAVAKEAAMIEQLTAIVKKNSDERKAIARNTR